MFEWDPYTLPIIAEKAGAARFVDLISGISVREDTDEATGMTQRIVSDWRSATKGNDLKPEVIIMDPVTGDPVRNAAAMAWLMMNGWLQNFAYRIKIEWWMLALGAIGALIIAFVTVGFQAIKAAIANPVKSLRTE